ncbi:hypothetical protein LWC35_21330 [Pseudonocardia kujensis]|uniref:hypothetical protein n=1 Tax=Pseudonocardia kujensis TaxID=1128675 RepID=UPI001E582C43|nr:hypothetical protein [Pseudonocardia kujensis]MCE0765423.1 hypothetical protein [Pseudonocardia kujensis]
MPSSSTVPDADEERHVLAALYGDEADPDQVVDAPGPRADAEAAAAPHTGTVEDDPKGS